MSLETIAIEATTASRIVKNYSLAYGTSFGIHQETAFPNIRVQETRRYKTFRSPWERADIELGYARNGEKIIPPEHTELPVRRLTHQS